MGKQPTIQTKKPIPAMCAQEYEVGLAQVESLKRKRLRLIIY